jgi:translation initiation factor 2 subunit 3
MSVNNDSCLVTGNSVNESPLVVDLDEIQKLQPILNIGTIGHVSNGKSTIVKQTSGKRPQQFAEEQIRNITIQLGYANVKIYKCEKCENHECVPSETKLKNCDKCKIGMKLIRHFSWVDCPGHQSYMSTMVNGAAVMDAALIVIAADEHIPQPQTAEHLVAVELMELKHGVVALNKLDLITKDQAKEAYKTTLAFLKDTSFENSAVIPVCANYGFNINLIAKAICETIPIPVKNYNLSPRMIVIRSFDVSKSGESAVSVKGGVAGGSIMQGIMRVGQKIEIRPGLIYQRPNAETGETEFLYKPLQTTIVSLLSEKTSLQMAIPGGLIGVGTKLDPALTKQNRLVGQVIGLDLPDVYDELKLKYKLIMTFQCDKPFTKGEQLLLNVQSCEISGSIIMVSSKSKYIIVKLSKPVCVDLNDKVSISKNVNQDWRLAGYGKIERGKPVIRLE